MPKAIVKPFFLKKLNKTDFFEVRYVVILCSDDYLRHSAFAHKGDLSKGVPKGIQANIFLRTRCIALAII